MKINLEKIDNICDYIPIISTVSNLTNLFQKHVFLNLPGVKDSPIPKKDYYVHIQAKSNFRTVALLVPFIGNFIVAIHDYKKKIQRADRAKVEEANKLGAETDFSGAIKAARGISNSQVKRAVLTEITEKMTDKVNELIQPEKPQYNLLKAKIIAKQIPDDCLKKMTLEKISARRIQGNAFAYAGACDFSFAKKLAHRIMHEEIKQLTLAEINNCEKSISLANQDKMDEAREASKLITSDELSKTISDKIKIIFKTQMPISTL